MRDNRRAALAPTIDLQTRTVRYQDTVAPFADLGGGWWSVPAEAAEK
jgi:hypothetical protein